MTKQSEPKTSPPVIRAIDLGWGYCKYSKADLVDETITYHSFPSLAPRAANSDLAGSLLGGRDTVRVTVSGTDYEVGPDTSDLDSSDSSRNLNNGYVYSDQYMAVYLGALHYMGESQIDLLVCGLPVSNMQAAPKLKEILEGEFEVQPGQMVKVKEVLVIPQPLGGLYYCLGKSKEIDGLEDMKEETNLILDIGFLTFDFLLANGTKVIENRSGATNGGVSKVLRSVAESVSKKFGINYSNLSALDKGLRKRKIKIAGEVESLDEHIKATRDVLESSVTYCKNISGEAGDIDNIIVLGGGATIYRKTIELAYPKHSIVVVEDAQLCNVQGFQLAGEEYLRKKR